VDYSGRGHMPKKSAGLLLFRRNSEASQFEVLLVHPGGPFWRKKDEGAWTIPKGEFADDEDGLGAAQREFREETGSDAPAGDYLPLKPVKQAGGKIVHAWAIEGDFNPAGLQSNSFSFEWPPRSGHTQEFPEVDRAEWFAPDLAKRKILSGQIPLINELVELLEAGFLLTGAQASRLR
jgi:predicted NUDIX family NTP pyrophosphohydrolase